MICISIDCSKDNSKMLYFFPLYSNVNEKKNQSIIRLILIIMIIVNSIHSTHTIVQRHSIQQSVCFSNKCYWICIQPVACQIIGKLCNFITTHTSHTFIRFRLFIPAFTVLTLLIIELKLPAKAFCNIVISMCLSHIQLMLF